MRDFWETHHWPEGERRAHWHLLFEDQPAVHDFARAHAGLLAQHAELSPVPVEWLHATLQSVGPLTAETAAAVADAARLALVGIEPFEIEIGPAQAIHNGVVPADLPRGPDLGAVLGAAARDRKRGRRGHNAQGPRAVLAASEPGLQQASGVASDGRVRAGRLIDEPLDSTHTTAQFGSSTWTFADSISSDA